MIEGKCTSCGRTQQVPEGSATEGLCWECYRRPLDQIDQWVREDLRESLKPKPE